MRWGGCPRSCTDQVDLSQGSTRTMIGAPLDLFLTDNLVALGAGRHQLRADLRQPPQGTDCGSSIGGSGPHRSDLAYFCQRVAFECFDRPSVLFGLSSEPWKRMRQVPGDRGPPAWLSSSLRSVLFSRSRRFSMLAGALLPRYSSAALGHANRSSIGCAGDTQLDVVREFDVEFLATVDHCVSLDEGEVEDVAPVG
jgi:hypothetical protein